jgi:hypothetical protein
VASKQTSSGKTIPPQIGLHQRPSFRHLEKIEFENGAGKLDFPLDSFQTAYNLFLNFMERGKHEKGNLNCHNCIGARCHTGRRGLCRHRCYRSGSIEGTGASAETARRVQLKTLLLAIPLTLIALALPPWP